MQKSRVIEFECLGTHWWITILDEAEYSLFLEEQILKMVEIFESKYTRFKETSLIGLLNKNKSLPRPGPELRNILVSCQKYFESTEGLFNITVGSELEKSGYGVGTDLSSKISDNPENDIIVSKEKIQISRTVRVDLGGIGKGWLIDKLSRYLRKNIKQGYVINGGGDMFIDSTEPIPIALEHPFNPEEFVGTVEVRGGFASSSTVKRRWLQNNVERNHIVNTLGSENEFVASYVKAPTCVQADVMATVLLLADAKLRERLARKFKLEYLLIRQDLYYQSSKSFGAKLF